MGSTPTIGRRPPVCAGHDPLRLSRKRPISARGTIARKQTPNGAPRNAGRGCGILAECTFQRGAGEERYRARDAEQPFMICLPMCIVAVKHNDLGLACMLWKRDGPEYLCLSKHIAATVKGRPEELGDCNPRRRHATDHRTITRMREHRTTRSCVLNSKHPPQ